MKLSSFVLTLTIAVVVFFGGGMTAWTLGTPPVRTVPVATVSVDIGEAWVQKNGVGDLQQISVQTPLQSGDVVKTGANSRAHIDFFHGSSARLDEKAEVVVDEASVAPNNFASSNVSLTVRAGRVWNRVLKFLDGSNSSYTANVSNVVATVRGTTFVIDATDPSAWLVQTVESTVGVHVASNTPAEQMVDSGEEAFVAKVASTSLQYLRDSTRLLKRKIVEKTWNSEWFGNNKQWDAAYVSSVADYRTKELRDRAGMLPGSLLYGLKHVGEKLRIALTGDASSREALSLEFADRRFAEIVTLALGGRANVAERLIADLQSPYLVLLNSEKDAKVAEGDASRICESVQGRLMEQEMYVRDLGSPTSLQFLFARGTDQNDPRVLWSEVCLKGGLPSVQLPPTSNTPPVTSSSTLQLNTSATFSIGGQPVQDVGATGTTPSSPSPVTQPQTNATLTKVSIVSNRTMLTHPDQQQTHAYATFSDGSSKEVTNDSIWESSNTNVFTVQNGLVTTVAIGSTTLRATYQNVLATFSLRVLPQVSPTATVQSLVVSCSPSSLSATATFTQTSTCSATAKMSDGSTNNVTSATKFSTNGSLGGMNGSVFTANGQTGIAVITATYSSGTQVMGTGEILIQ